MIKHEPNNGVTREDERAVATGVSRRGLMVGAGIGLVASGLATLAAEGKASAATPTWSPPADLLAAARKEGRLLLWHGDQEADVVKFLQIFTKKTGIAATEQYLLPGAALPKLQAELRAHETDVDVYDTSDAGLMTQLQKQGRLLQYMSPELGAYASHYKSTPPGYWATYYVNIGTMMYDPRHVAVSIGPKTWTDLLNREWKGQVGFQNAAAGSQYAWWYLLRQVLPADYWTKLAAQKPRAYTSSTQIVEAINDGNLKIGGKVSIFQYAKSLKRKEPLHVVFPPEGSPAQNQVSGIIATTKRPNAAKIYTDFLLSQEGQTIWNNIQGSPSARTDVKVADLPDMSGVKLLHVTDMADFESRANHQEFVKLWNKITGF